MIRKSKTKNKLDIAMIGQKRLPSREGGIEIVVEELATRMVKLGHSVTCYTRKGKHVSGKEYSVSPKLKEYKGIRIIPVFTPDIKGVAAMVSSVLASIMACFGRYDVVHYHAEGPCATIWLPKLFGKRTVATIHGLDWQRAKWGKFASAYLKFGERMAAKYADEIIVLSENAKQYFKNTYDRDTNYIHNGINKPEVLPANAIAEKWGLHKDEYILFLSRIVPEKGLHYLIEAFRATNTDKKLVIAGGASNTAEYVSSVMRQAEGDDRILFTGFVQGAELEELYSNAYIYVLPSDLEGMPISLLEAMSYGNCCLTSDIPECTEMTKYRAISFRKGDAKHLAERLQYLCDNEDIVNKYRSGISDFICDKYKWDNVVEQTLDLYTDSDKSFIKRIIKV